MAIRPATTTIFMVDAGPPGSPAQTSQGSKPRDAAHRLPATLARSSGSPASASFWRRALPTFATVAAVAVFVSAGNWQRGRMLQKEALGEQLAAALAAPVAPLPAGDADWSAWRFRTVEAKGRFDASRQILVDNKVHRGRAGYHVVTPLVLDDGRAVLIDRGWIAGGTTRSELPVAPVPAGEVALRGRLNLPPQGYVELASTAPERGVWQNLDPARFALATGLPVLPVVIEATDGAGDGLAREWPRPDAGAEKHRIYMVQWYAFAALAAGLWAWFTLRKR